MALQVIEGTWEEIERRKAELIGRHLRVTIVPEKGPRRQQLPSKPVSASKSPSKKLVGMGAFKGKTGEYEAFAREKRVQPESRLTANGAFKDALPSVDVYLAEKHDIGGEA